MNIENFKFQNTRGTGLAGRIYSREINSGSGIIFSHGLFSSKDGYKITRMAETIVSSGFTLMTFDFSFSGESEGCIKEISLSGEVDDLKCAIGIFLSKGIKKIHLMGSSMGAAVTILAASESIVPVESLILIAAPIDFRNLIPGITKTGFESADINGYTPISGIMVNNRFIGELLNTDMTAAVKNIPAPVLLIHGRNDSVVDFSNHKQFINNCPAECSSLVIEDGDHNLTRESDIAVISESVKGWLGNFNI
jgi:putative redox protein